MEEYWIVDPGLRRVERYLPGSDAAQILTDRLSWQPRPGIPPLVIDLRPFFERIWRGLGSG